MKRYLALLLACLMVISLFAACGKKEEEKEPADNAATEENKDDAAAEEEGESLMTANGEVPIVNEKMEFDVACRQVSNVTDMPTNSFVLWLEDKTNIHINYEMIPEDAISEKTNLILASGQYPDGFQYSSITTTLQVKYGAQGAFVDLAPYFEKYGHYANEAYAATTYLPKAITTPDGNIYCIAGVNECYHCFYSVRAWINSQWLEAIGKEMPQTTDELKAVLEAFRDTDLNGNGDASDEIPFIGTGYNNGAWMGYATNWLMEAYLYDDYDMLIAVNPDSKTIEYQATKDEYKQGLTMIKEWYDEGLIDPEFLSITGSELETLGMGEEPRLASFVAALWWAGVGNLQVEDDGVYRERNYEIMANVEGPNGVRNTYTNLEGIGGNFVITNACEHPEVLFRWCDYQMSDEASIRAYAGSYEESVSVPDEGALGINKEPALYKLDKGSDHASSDTNENCDNVAISNKSAAIRLGQQTDWDNPEAYYDSETRLYIDTNTAQAPNDSSQFSVPTLVMGEEDANKRSELETPIRDYQREWMANFILGNADLEADWDAYVSGFDGIRLPEYLELLNKYYQLIYVG
jgi:putative aldouronate transport system substrate-binding protein